MKRFYLALAMLAALPAAASAQTILNEGFETTSTDQYSPNFPDGWSTVDSYTGNNDRYRWNVYYYEKGTMTGTHCASVDSPMFTGGEDGGEGPREEILLTPELNLDNTYQLSFDWMAASKAAIDEGKYDFQVRIVTDGNVEGAETIWSFNNATQLKENGNVPYPWTAWTPYKTMIDLSKWQGKSIKVAFVYKMLKATANVLDIDNVVVKQFTPATGPKGVLSKKQYNFGEVYMDSKMFSDVITLKNEGKSGLKITSIDYPQGVGSTIDPAVVDLDANASLDFKLSYTAALTTPQSGYVTLHTTGGDLQIKVLATKVALPDGYTFEGFENGCPPAGWTGNGWKASNYSIEGDYTAYASVTLDGASYLTTPRLDMSTGAHSVAFSAFNEFDSDEENAVPDNDVTLEFSKDGGATWATVWESTNYNALEKVSVDLGSPASDNCLLRWAYSAVDISSSDNIPETSVAFIDAIILPPLYGNGGKPAEATLVSPADKSENLYNKNITLTWRPALFADGYKLYVGSDAAATNLVNGQDLGNATSYVIASADYATTYNWKVVPYNAQGDAEKATVWTFTTIADQTISTFPWTENFESGNEPPTGWNVEYDSYTKWSTTNKVNPFEGKYSASVGCNAIDKSSQLVTPDFKIPAGSNLQMSFYWGNAMPVSLLKDETGLRQNPSTADNGVDACFFEVLDGGEWHQLAVLSDNSDDRYWYLETVNLAAYAGKTVTFRWRYVGHDYDNAKGVGLDLITVTTSADTKASFNATDWNAGTVNYYKTVNSTPKFSVINEGSTALTIKSAKFSTENFTTDLAAGTTIEPKKGAAFSITFSALNAEAQVNDNLVVEFDGGYSISMPVTGLAMAADSHYYDFENDTPGALAPEGFTTIDVDRQLTKPMAGMNYPQRGAATAFTVQQNSDWNNVLDPVSGNQTLVAIASQDESSTVDDWLISQQLTATDKSKFHFYARNWESTLAINPCAQSCVEVLVSTTDNTNTASFTSVMPTTTMPYYNKETWEHYSVDLSKYAGQKIYVAVRHTVKDGLAAFFDDFYFEHFTNFGGVDNVNADNKVTVYPNPVASTLFVNGADADTQISIYNAAGSLVANVVGSQANVEGLAPGVYVVRVATANGIATTRIIKK